MQQFQKKIENYFYVTLMRKTLFAYNTVIFLEMKNVFKKILFRIYLLFFNILEYNCTYLVSTQLSSTVSVPSGLAVYLAVSQVPSRPGAAEILPTSYHVAANCTRKNIILHTN